MTEKFEDDTLIEMSQTELPTNKDIEKQIEQIMMQAQRAGCRRRASR